MRQSLTLKAQDAQLNQVKMRELNQPKKDKMYYLIKEIKNKILMILEDINYEPTYDILIKIVEHAVEIINTTSTNIIGGYNLSPRRLFSNRDKLLDGNDNQCVGQFVVYERLCNNSNRHIYREGIYLGQELVNGISLARVLNTDNWSTSFIDKLYFHTIPEHIILRLNDRHIHEIREYKFYVDKYAEDFSELFDVDYEDEIYGNDAVSIDDNESNYDANIINNSDYMDDNNYSEHDDANSNSIDANSNSADTDANSNSCDANSNSADTDANSNSIDANSNSGNVNTPTAIDGDMS
jgi:hypothetical protein